MVQYFLFSLLKNSLSLEGIFLHNVGKGSTNALYKLIIDIIDSLF
mgnify:CR=1 FL=1